MTSRTPRKIFAWLVVGCLAAVAVCLFVFRDPLLEMWYLHRLGSDDDAVRRGAARGLGGLRSTRAVSRLVEIYLGGRGDRESAYAVEALAEIGEKGIDPLVEGLRGADWPTRRLAVETLRDCGAPPPWVLAILTDGVRYRQSSQVRADSATLLGEVGEQGLPALAEALSDRDSRVRRTAASAMGTIGWEGVRRLGQVLDDEKALGRARVEALRALGGLGPRASAAYDFLVRATQDEKLGGLAEEALENIVPVAPKVAEFWIPPAKAFPGEVAVLELRASLPHRLGLFLLHFDLSDPVAEFLRVEPTGTVAAELPSRRLIFNPRHAKGGFLAGFDSGTGSASRWPPMEEPKDPDEPEDPGDDVVLLRAVLRVDSAARPGTYSVDVKKVHFSWGGRPLPVQVRGSGSLTIQARAGPPPVADLVCRVEGEEVTISWRPPAGEGTIVVRRGGEKLAEVDGSEARYRDLPPPGNSTYRISVLRAAKESPPAICEVTVHGPGPQPVEGLSCTQKEDGIVLAWTNSGTYDALVVERGGRPLAEVDGSTTSFRDPLVTDLATVYRVTPRAGDLVGAPATCSLNTLGEPFAYRAEDVHVEPGAKGIPIRVYASNIKEAQGFSVGLRLDPGQAKIVELSVDGTKTEADGHDRFLYQTHVLDTGETSAGVIFDMTGGTGSRFQKGAEKHALTVQVDLLAGVAAGTVIPVELGSFGDPPASSIFTIDEPGRGAQSRAAALHGGAIFVGPSPVATVTSLKSEVVLEEKPAGSAPSPGEGGSLLHARGIRLEWKAPESCEGLRIERDGKEIARLPGSVESFLDTKPGPGVHRYRVYTKRGDKESFPVSLVAPAGARE